MSNCQRAEIDVLETPCVHVSVCVCVSIMEVAKQELRGDL